jgi:hypothetical protein
MLNLWRNLSARVAARTTSGSLLRNPVTAIRHTFVCSARDFVAFSAFGLLARGPYTIDNRRGQGRY